MKQCKYMVLTIIHKIERSYYLEVSEDSIWLESQEGLVYSGKYTDLDSLICEDNR
jgi:hypothetical protein